MSEQELFQIAIYDCYIESIFAVIHYWCEQGKYPEIEKILWFINLTTGIWKEDDYDD